MMVGTHMANNLEELASIIGTFQGISDAAKDERFIQKILVEANEKYLDKFNRDAAAHAISMGGKNRAFRHMYEFGVAGITPGPVTIADPTSQEARLWVFTSFPVGRSVVTTFTYRDAVKPNPAPEERRDLKKFKVPPEVIARMSDRKYVFRRRAELTEKGATVRMEPKNAEALIFPSRDNPNGYGFWHKRLGTAAVNLDGQYGAGISRHKYAFTNYFMAKWNKEAENEARQSAHQSFASRIGHTRKNIAKQKAMKRAEMVKIAAEAKKARAKAKKDMMKKVAG